MHYRFQHRDQTYEITIERSNDPNAPYRASINGAPASFDLLDAQSGEISIELGGRPTRLFWAVDGNTRWISVHGCTYRLDRPVLTSARKHPESSSGESVRAPMPAQVRAVLAEIGRDVGKGDTLLLLEAMKMEIRVRAPVAGKVTRLLVTAGQFVEKDQLLAEVGG